ncbi:4-deoxy-L-threo-5-hexosulose-uronate ketol-isomerase [Nocardioides baekrokdamisoli]|uniref:5-dehydro-4-deoxy-D-glucuronate isomerase n=1 Tax=Nocardioides baekrokdamisoli TaxID=1804624 RepID=A0A3G9IWM3_9ACTN|nr:5-dehydro-4-deoxy-D-glucuronate isomerase [Nocardioides baekrokdamisoli]BBH16753.1 4-deoxy-L-threo-5-hexosulose-uronate ketol-isomerase [Nocardioides baekrokdamisoli]
MTDVRIATHPDEFATLTPEQMRERFLVQDLFAAGEVRWMLSQSDRILLGGAVPNGANLAITAPDEVRAINLCDRRELGVVCLSGTGTVTVDGQTFEVEAEDIVYVGAGTVSISVSGDATFYLVSAPAHLSHPTTLIKRADAQTLIIGDADKASLRTLRKYVHDQGVASCELALGITTIEPGNVWNTMPCHTHDRRTECYLYFDVPDGERVVHIAGQPGQTRSMIVADREAIISPPWSVHFGAGTAPYKFVWSTAGENLAYNDMDPVVTTELR